MAHRTRSHLGGSVEFDRLPRLAWFRCEHRGEKARNRPSRSREQRPIAGRRRKRAPATGYLERRRIRLEHRDSESLQARPHAPRIVGDQQTGKPRPAPRERREQQGPIREALGAGRAHFGIERRGRLQLQ